MSDDKPSNVDLTHQPLPYRVTLRVSQSDDAPLQTITTTVVAYSVIEAVMQASMEQSGYMPNEGKCRVEKIEPDVVAYLLMLLQHPALGKRS